MFNSHKHSIIPIWLTTLVGICFLVGGSKATKCFECEASRITDSCLKTDSSAKERECHSAMEHEGCLTFRVTYEGKDIFQSGGRNCIEPRHLECFHSSTGLDLKDGQCIRTNLELEIVDKIERCWLGGGILVSQRKNGEGILRQDPDYKGMDLRVCTCKGDLCNSIENWKPDKIKYVEAKIGGGPKSKDSGSRRWTEVSKVGGCLTYLAILINSFLKANPNCN